ncbi:MAG: hypothetical protein ACP6IT_11140 [Candidatus Thorarchaeota archaeon]
MKLGRVVIAALFVSFLALVPLGQPPVHTAYAPIRTSAVETLTAEAFIWNYGGVDKGFDLVIHNDYVYTVGTTTSFGEGYSDIVLIKWSMSGEVIWYRTWGTPGIETAAAIDAWGSNIYVAGLSDNNLVVLCFNDDGDLQWSQTCDSEFEVGDIAVNSQGIVYVMYHNSSWGVCGYGIAAWNKLGGFEFAVQMDDTYFATHEMIVTSSDFLAVLRERTVYGDPYPYAAAILLNRTAGCVDGLSVRVPSIGTPLFLAERADGKILAVLGGNALACLYDFEADTASREGFSASNIGDFGLTSSDEVYAIQRDQQDFVVLGFSRFEDGLDLQANCTWDSGHVDVPVAIAIDRDTDTAFVVGWLVGWSYATSTDSSLALLKVPLISETTTSTSTTTSTTSESSTTTTTTSTTGTTTTISGASTWTGTSPSGDGVDVGTVIMASVAASGVTAALVSVVVVLLFERLRGRNG